MDDCFWWFPESFGSQLWTRGIWKKRGLIWKECRFDAHLWLIPHAFYSSCDFPIRPKREKENWWRRFGYFKARWTYNRRVLPRTASSLWSIRESCWLKLVSLLLLRRTIYTWLHPYTKTLLYPKSGMMRCTPDMMFLGQQTKVQRKRWSSARTQTPLKPQTRRRTPGR
jgi:hypothetical protein